ncbi:MAG: ABC transporter ATP-binding protein [Candidatus Saccharimonadales bacterium]
MPLIKLEEVSKLYGFGDATTLALDEVNISIEKGEFIAVMGPSGCGKSTLLNIMGLLDRPTSGTYKLQNRVVERLGQNRAAKLRRDTIGFIFQSYNMLPRQTVLDNVALPLVYKGIGVTKRLKLASAMLERVGMQNREYFFPTQLSGGQVQCAAIARALVNEPSIIIADEPTGNLDSVGSRLVMELLSEIHMMGNTIIFVTHNPELTRYATRVIYMRDGMIIQDESTSLGEVAKTAKKRLYTVRAKTIEDDLAGVSLLMKTVPDKSSASSGRKKTNPKRRNIKKSKGLK